MTTNVFKMRLELVCDAFTFLTKFFVETEGEFCNIEIDKNDYLSGELTIRTKRDIKFVKNIIKSLSNLHCMYETIEKLEDYSRIRRINL